MEAQGLFAPDVLAPTVRPQMKAIRLEHFGPPEVMVCREIERPVPASGQVLVRVKAAGVGPWDAWVRTGRSALVTAEALPVTPGSDIAGIVEAVGPGDSPFEVGDEVFGVTNAEFTGAYAEFAVAANHMVARKPTVLSFAEAASVPVIAVTAWQMLFDHARLARGQTVLILGASGNVGAFAVQLAHSRGLNVIATGSPDEIHRLRTLGANQVVDARTGCFELAGGLVDAVIDTVGIALHARALPLLKAGGVFVSAVASLDDTLPRQHGVRGVFFIVDVTTDLLARIAGEIDSGGLRTHVGPVLPLEDAPLAHEMLDGLRPYRRGKIVLTVDH
jgi:NADPH:quinone reductase-like Zn-dependent oxidoreductase